MDAPPDRLTITVLGSGTSSGVPTLTCDCATCTSTDPRDNRLRTSILVRFGGRSVVIDTTPDFRQQALRARLKRLDAVLYTHGHFDHVMGLDDVRPFNFHQKGDIPIYAAPEAMATIKQCFPYVFDEGPTLSSRPRLDTHLIGEESIDLFGVSFLPLRLCHGKGVSHGFRFGPAAYLTDHSDIPEETLAKLEGLDVLFLDALRYKPHPTHSTIDRSLQYVDRLAPRRAYFTHISHDILHERAESRLPEHVRLAYDGLEIEVSLNGREG